MDEFSLNDAPAGASTELFFSSSVCARHDALIASSERCLALYTAKACAPCAYAKKAIELLQVEGLLLVPSLTFSLTKSGIDILAQRGVEVGGYPILVLYRDGRREKDRIGFPSGDTEASLSEFIKWIG